MIKLFSVFSNRKHKSRNSETQRYLCGKNSHTRTECVFRKVHRGFHPFQWTHHLCRLLCADVLAGVFAFWQVGPSVLQQHSCCCQWIQGWWVWDSVMHENVYGLQMVIEQ